MYDHHRYVHTVFVPLYMVLMYLNLPTVFSALRIFALQKGKGILPGIILLSSIVAVAFNTVRHPPVASPYPRAKALYRFQYYLSKATMVVQPYQRQAVAHGISGPLCIAIISGPDVMNF